MKKFLAPLTVLLILLPAVSQAHILKIDGDIGVTIHVNPDDDPVIGQPSSFFLEIKDRTDKFDPANCTCTAAIVQNGTTLASSSVFASNSVNDFSNPFFSYTFPAKGVYTFKVDGAPKTGGSFQKFSVTYDLRVERGSNEPVRKDNRELYLYTVLAAIFLGAVFSIIHFNYTHRKRIQ